MVCLLSKEKVMPDNNKRAMSQEGGGIKKDKRNNNKEGRKPTPRTKPQSNMAETREGDGMQRIITSSVTYANGVRDHLQHAKHYR